MSLNPGGTTNYSWNYSKPDKPGYSTLLIGTVLAIQEVQKMSYTMNGQPGAPEFWPDGNPKMNIRLALATESGELKTFTFQPAGKEARAGRKPSVHMSLFHLTGDTDMMNLIGKTICIQTQEGHYGQGNPRPWSVGEVQAGPFSLPNELPSEFKAPQVLANNAVAGGQMQPPMQQQGYGYQQPPMQQQYYQQPQMQQQPMPQQYYQQPQMQGYQQPMNPQPQMQPQPMPQMQPQPAMQPQMQQAPQGYPQGMDPSVAAAMQQMGVASVQEVGQVQSDPVVGSVYDDVPF